MFGPDLFSYWLLFCSIGSGEEESLQRFHLDPIHGLSMIFHNSLLHFTDELAFPGSYDIDGVS